jgi:hypothetical protein
LGDVLLYKSLVFLFAQVRQQVLTPHGLSANCFMILQEGALKADDLIGRIQQVISASGAKK